MNRPVEAGMYATKRDQARFDTPINKGSTVDEETAAAEAKNVVRRNLSRRSVVRTAAWTVPAISIVSAAPAFAANSDTLAFSGTPRWIDKKTLSVAFSVVNNSTTDSAQTLRVDLSVAPTFASVTLTNGSTWTLASSSSTSGSITLACPSVAASTASPFTLVFTYGSSAGRTVNITGTVTTVSAFNPQTVSLTPSINSSN